MYCLSWLLPHFCFWALFEIYVLSQARASKVTLTTDYRSSSISNSPNNLHEPYATPTSHVPNSLASCMGYAAREAAVANQQAQDTHPMLIQCWTTVYGTSPTLIQCVVCCDTMLLLLVVATAAGLSISRLMAASAATRTCPALPPPYIHCASLPCSVRQGVWRHVHGRGEEPWMYCYKHVGFGEVDPPG